MDVQEALSGDPECELVQPHVQHLAAAMEVLHVALIQKQMYKQFNNLDVLHDA